MAIGVGDEVNHDELRCIASGPELVVNTTDFTTLPQLQESLVSVACDIPVREYSLPTHREYSLHAHPVREYSLHAHPVREYSLPTHPRP